MLIKFLISGYIQNRSYGGYTHMRHSWPYSVKCDPNHSATVSSILIRGAEFAFEKTNSSPSRITLTVVRTSVHSKRPLFCIFALHLLKFENSYKRENVYHV